MFSSIKVQIILSFIGITLFTGLMVSLVSYWESKQFLDSMFNKGLENTAGLIEKNIEDNLSETGKIILDISKRPEVVALDAKKINPLIENFIAFSDLFFNVYIYNKDGKVISASYFDKRSTEPYIGENFKDYKNNFPDYATKVFTDGKPRFTGTFYSKAHKLFLSYIAPIQDKNEIKGIISCGIYVQDKKLERLLETLKPPYNGFIYLADEQGNTLAYTGNIPSRDDIKLENLLKNELLTTGGKEYRYKLTKVSQAGIYILVAVPASIASGLLEKHTWNIILCTVLILIIAILININFATLLTRPVSLLVEGLQEVGKGNYAFRIDFKARGEFSSAIKAFNEMAEKLQKNTIIEKIWIENWKD